MDNDDKYKNAVERLREIYNELNKGHRYQEDIAANKNIVITNYGKFFSSIAEKNEDEIRENFKQFLYIDNNHHWSSLYRRGLEAVENTNLCNALKKLLNENENIEDRFKNAIEMVAGLGPAIATAILTVAYPDKYGVWNGASEDGLKKLGLWPNFKKRSMNIGQKYVKINEELKKLCICKKLNIDFWTLDILWVIICGPKNVIYYGPPGTGKTYVLNKKLQDYTDTKDNKKISSRYAFVTFHQSYGYEEFVEGLRPVIKNEKICYDIRPGVFRKICEKAKGDKNNRYAIVIDEINRGNISKIFGELITLIEPDKREGADQAISLTLAYSDGSFSVPPNVDIIGTMNTADRSLALVDTALRRRFEFIPMMPDTSEKGPLKGIKVETENNVVIDIRLMLEKMNLRIEALYDRDHTIGHAYFIGINDFEELKKVFRRRILPLLEEYFFDDWEKIRLVLGDNQKEDINLQFITVKNNDNYVAELFGKNNHDLGPNSIRKRYQINEKAFDQPKAYELIYEKADRPS